MGTVDVSAARRAAVLLSLVSGIGPLTRRALLDRFGTAEDVFRAAPSDLRSVQGMGVKLTRAVVRAPRELDVDAELQRCHDCGLAVLLDTDDQYPRALREIHDPPGVLFARGELLARDTLSIAIVGTRHATAYGRRQAERLATGLARTGLTIVSGLARGIDGVAHRAALSGGRTIAVLGSGLLNIYPPEHRKLAARVAERGVVLSEAPPLAKPLSGAFPQRNRLISGLSLGVIVVEAADRSGALISAEHAMEQGREVYAVPGPADSRTSRGCHRLLREGAKLVESVEDVIEELGPLVEAAPGEDGDVVHHPCELLLNDQEQAVLSAIQEDPTNIDSVAAASSLPIHRVLSTISVLEMRHLIRRISGQLVARR